MKKLSALFMGAAIAVSLFGFVSCKDQSFTDWAESGTLKSLGTDGKHIVNSDGKYVSLRGTNAGNWLIQELWMAPTKNTVDLGTGSVHDQTSIMEVLESRFGEKQMNELLDIYKDNYWTEQDFANIKAMNMNCIRLPFWWRDLTDADGNWYGYDETASDPYETAFKRVDWFVETAGKYGLYVILDFHGVPGSQSGSDHSGVDGGSTTALKKAASKFWPLNGNDAELAAKNQELFYEMWKVIAKRYKTNGTVAAYDVMNEPFSSYASSSYYSMLWEVYDKAYDAIRSVDKNHIVIFEAVWDAAALPTPSVYGWENIVYEYHKYTWSDYDNTSGSQTSGMASLASNVKKHDVPSYIGEFCLFNSIEAWNKALTNLNSSDISWTNWTYKVTHINPNGGGSPIVNGNWGIYTLPEELDYGIDLENSTYDEIATFWAKTNTANASPNQSLIDALTSICAQ